jgi:hypothetical protein
MGTAMEQAVEEQSAMDHLNAVIRRGGYACLGCEKPTTSEGQVCPACVESGIRVENDTVMVSLEIRVPESFRR